MSQRRPRDKEKTVRDIMSTARHLFSEKGIHGTSIRDIEDASGIAKGLILHHFGTKEKLYAAVQDLLAEDYVKIMNSKRQKDQGFRNLLVTSIRSSFKHIKENPEYHRISLWSYLEKQERNTDTELRFTEALIEAMRVGQQSGVVRDDIDAFLMPFIIKGTIDYWIQKRKLINKLITNSKYHYEGDDDSLINALAKLFSK